MASSAANSVMDRNIEQLLAFVDQTTAEVATLQNKFDLQKELVEAFTLVTSVALKWPFKRLKCTLLNTVRYGT